MSDEQKEQIEEFVTSFKQDLIEAREKYKKSLNISKIREVNKSDIPKKVKKSVDGIKNLKKTNFDVKNQFHVEEIWMPNSFGNRTIGKFQRQIVGKNLTALEIVIIIIYNLNI